MNRSGAKRRTPTVFPNNPHFSGLIGGTHNSAVTFWEAGGLASPGVKRVAELGVKSTFRDEVESAIEAGSAEHVVSGSGIRNSPDSVQLEFQVSQQHSLLTLISMLAPSPDWFVGVSGLDLFDFGDWRDAVITLYVYDAGTDSGPSYASPNQPTSPPEEIERIESGPFLIDGAVDTDWYVYPGTADRRLTCGLSADFHPQLRAVAGSRLFAAASSRLC